MASAKFDPIIHDCEAFECWLRDRGLQNNTINSHVSNLKRISRTLEIEIGPATIGGRDDAAKRYKDFKDKIEREVSHGYMVAANAYADFVDRDGGRVPLTLPGKRLRNPTTPVRRSRISSSAKFNSRASSTPSPCART